MPKFHQICLFELFIEVWSFFLKFSKKFISFKDFYIWSLPENFLKAILLRKLHKNFCKVQNMHKHAQFWKNLKYVQKYAKYAQYAWFMAVFFRKKYQKYDLDPVDSIVNSMTDLCQEKMCQTPPPKKFTQNSKMQIKQNNAQHDQL